MNPPLRRVMLTAHVVFSVGWVGAVFSFLVLAFAGLISQDPETARAAHIAMDLTGWFAIVPLAFASLLTGLIQSLGTDWGLFRHYWVLIKFLLTAFATTVLMVHTQLIGLVAHAAANGSLQSPELGAAKGQLIFAAGGGLVVLLVITALSVYKPRGRTRYGLRKQRQNPPRQQEPQPSP